MRRYVHLHVLCVEVLEAVVSIWVLLSFYLRAAFSNGFVFQPDWLFLGLYLLHDEDGWETTKDLFDYSIFVDADVDMCIERVKIRNKCIPGYTEEEIEERCEIVDRVNAMTVDRSKKRADFVVQSVVT